MSITVSPRGAKSKLFVPCARIGNTRCPERMQLQIRDENGRDYETPFYKCMGPWCRFHKVENGIPVDQVNWAAVVRDSNAPKHKDGDVPTDEEMELML